LEWDSNPPSDQVAGYNIYRSTQSGTGYVQLNSNLISTTTYRDSTIVASLTYYYVCTAENGEGLESGYSNEVAFTAPAIQTPNDPPIAVSDSATTDEDQPISINVVSNDSDPNGDSLSIVGVSQATMGSVTVQGDTSVLYAPFENRQGSDSFTYTISDGRGGVDEAAVAVTIRSVNDAPDAKNDQADTQQGEAVTISILANDTDVDDDSLTVTGVTQGDHGAVTVNSGTTVTYTPDPDFLGQDDFTYSISDGNGGSDKATVFVAVGEVNQVPQAVNDSATTSKNTSVRVNLVFNDLDADGDKLEIVDVTQGRHGSVIVHTKKSIQYTPARGFIGTDTLEYTVSDGKASSKATVLVRVLASVGAHNKLIFPTSINTGDSRLQETYVGVALLNPNYRTDSISLSSFDSEGLELANTQLGEPLPPFGQVAFLTDEGIDFGLGSVSLTAEGVMSSLQGFFMLGDYEIERLDGVGAELPAAETLYFPVVKQADSWTTLIHLINRDSEVPAKVTFELRDAEGNLIRSEEGYLAPFGSLMGHLTEIFGELPAMEEGSVKIEADSFVSGFEVVADDNSFSSLAARTPTSAKRLLAPQFFVDAATGGTSILRLLNTGSGETTVVMRAKNDESTELASKTVKVAPNALCTEDLMNFFEVPPETLTTGFLELEVKGFLGTASNLIGTITFSGFNGQASTTLPLVEQGELVTYYPHVAQTADGAIYTGFSILNAENDTATVTIEAFNRKGRRTASKELELAPGTRAIALLRSDTFFGEKFEQLEGHVRITSTGEVITFAVFGDYDGDFMSTIEGQRRLAQ
jgi:hypothetical protein